MLETEAFDVNKRIDAVENGPAFFRILKIRVPGGSVGPGQPNYGMHL